MAKRLTKSRIDKAHPQEREYTIWDDSLPGFGVRIRPGGTKTFIVQKRLGKGRREIKMNVGRYCAPMTLEVARQQAKEWIGEILQGNDPRRNTPENDITLAEFAIRFSEETDMRKKEQTIINEHSLLKHHIIPILGNVLVSELTRSDVARMMRKIKQPETVKIQRTNKARGKSIVRGGLHCANRARDVLSAIMTHAIVLELRQTNPVSQVKPFKTQKRERYLTKEEIGRLAQALKEADAAGENQYATAAIRLIFYTGARKGEIISLKWSYVDYSRSMAFLSDSKTGAKGLYLPRLAVELLEALPKRAGSPWVLPSLRGQGHLIGLQRVWSKIRRTAGIEDVRLHDLRHTFASVGAANGLSLFIIGKALGHSNPATTQRYAHLANDPISQAVDQIADHIGAL